MGTSLHRGFASDRRRPHVPDPARRRAAGSSKQPGSCLSQGLRSASAALRLPARVGAAAAPHSARPAARHPSARAKVAQIAPTTGKYSPAAAGTRGAEILGSLRQISHGKGGRRRRGRELQWRRRAALGLGCAERFWLCQGLCCNKGLPLPHSRACRTALSRPRLRGDSGSAHQFAAASASLPLPLARPPTPPLAARGTRGRLFVATSFCVGLRGGWRNPHRGGRRGGGLTTPLAPLPRVGLGPPPPVCTAGRDWAPPDSPRAGGCFPTPSRC